MQKNTFVTRRGRPGGLPYKRRFYRAWLTLSEWLHGVMTTAIFVVCYLAIALPFVLIVKILDPLRLRQHDEETYWIELRERKIDPASFERMG